MQPCKTNCKVANVEREDATIPCTGNCWANMRASHACKTPSPNMAQLRTPVMFSSILQPRCLHCREEEAVQEDAISEQRREPQKEHALQEAALEEAAKSTQTRQLRFHLHANTSQNKQRRRAANSSCRWAHRWRKAAHRIVTGALATS